MKKGWKIFWIVCACLAGLGVILCIGGFAMGATFAGIEHALWGVEKRVVQHTERLEERVDRFEDAYDDDYYENEEFEYATEGGNGNSADQTGAWENGNLSTSEGNVVASLSGIGELEIEVSHIQIEVQESDKDEIVFLTNNIPAEVEDDLMFAQEEDELKVFVRNKQNWKHVMNQLGEGASLTIQLPKKHNLRAISLSIGEGALEADNIQVSELEVAAGAGVAHIRHFDVNKLEVEVGAGEVNLTGSVSGEASIECGIGEVDYQAAGKQEDYSYDLEVGAGIVSIGEEEYSGLKSGKKIMNGGAIMEIECGIGEVNVGFTGA